MHLVCGVVAVAYGCRGRSSTGPATAPVSGTVTLDGEPMQGGEVRFMVPGQPPRVMPVENGGFSGAAFLGENQVDVVWERDGPPNPMNPVDRLKINVVSERFSGGRSPFTVDIPPAGVDAVTLAVTSAAK